MSGEGVIRDVGGESGGKVLGMGKEMEGKRFVRDGDRLGMKGDVV